MSINVGIVGFVGMDKSGVGKDRFGVAVGCGCCVSSLEGASTLCGGVDESRGAS